MAPRFGKAIPLWMRLFPKQAEPRGLKYSYPLSQVTTYQLTFQLTDVGLDMVNGVFIDNSNNTSGFTLLNPDTGDLKFIPANSQALLSLITAKSGDAITFVGASTGGIDVPIIFTNVAPNSDIIWSTVAAGQIIGAVTVQGQVTALPYASVGINAANETILVANTAQPLFVANAARKGLFIANPASGPSQGLGAVAPESIFIEFGANPAINGSPGTIEISPGGFYNPLQSVDTRAVNIIAASANHVFCAIQYQ